MFMTGRATIPLLPSYGELIIWHVPLGLILTLRRVFPDWLPFHPHKWWIHTRTVYIPMAYLYAIRYKMEENDLILALREVGLPDSVQHHATHMSTGIIPH